MPTHHVDPLTEVTVDVLRAWTATMREAGATDATIVLRRRRFGLVPRARGQASQ